MSPDGAPLVELEGVSLAYELDRRGRLEVLRDISLAVSPGELACVAGRSGSGKTSLLYVAAGFLRPDSGTVRWRGQRVERLPADRLSDERRGFLGFVFQGAGLIASLTAAENVAIVRGPDGRLATDRRGARSILGRLDLEAQADHFPHQLSGGEQQRIAVARALVGDPPLLLLDEPTAFLDRASADHVIDVLRQLRDEGRALLVASHDDHVTRLADHVVYLD